MKSFEIETSEFENPADDKTTEKPEEEKAQATTFDAAGNLTGFIECVVVSRVGHC
jgi:hypothetical protein